MHSVTDILNILLKSVFVGFGFVIPILALIRTSNIKAIAVKDLFILTAVQAVRIAGIFYFLLAAKDAYTYFFDGTSYTTSNVSAPAYMLFTFFPPAMTVVLSQLFWIKKLYMKKAALITFALLLLILPSDLFVRYLSHWALGTYGSLWLNFPAFPGLLSYGLLNIMVFIFIIFIIMLAGGKLKAIADK